jgi:3'-phosphoadenosine 5'-phosphosulfate synthase
MEFFGPGSNNDDFDFISGSRMRGMARNNEKLPHGFMSEKGWDVLAEYYRSLKD